MPDQPTAEVGIFGGSGFYELFADVDEVVLDTPYGAPSAPIALGPLGGRRVAFLPRHGRHHHLLPHQVNYRANVWAMHHLGVRSIAAPCSCGSLQPDLHPGDFVVVDQLVDRTWGRPDSFCEGPPVQHVAFADPYDGPVRRVLMDAARATGATVRDGGTMVVIQGPRFSTRAESRWFREMGWHVVNMTGYPEAVLARELDVPYASVALVTDYDAGVDGHAPVIMEAVFAQVARNVQRVRDVIVAAIADLP